jgi:hypothetical protein
MLSRPAGGQSQNRLTTAKGIDGILLLGKVK